MCEDNESADGYHATPEERAEGIRHAALHNAVLVTGQAADADLVLEAAKKFEAFLRG